MKYRKVGGDKNLGIELSGVSFPPSHIPPWDNQLVSQSISNQLSITMMILVALVSLVVMIWFKLDQLVN